MMPDAIAFITALLNAPTTQKMRVTPMKHGAQVGGGIVLWCIK